MASVRIDDVKKSFGPISVINGVSIDIGDGEFVVLVGPSGCGKSTLLRMIAGLESITAGTIRIGDRVVNNLQPKDRDIAMVFQNYALYPQMTVAQNMGFSLEMSGVKKDLIEEKVGKAADILGLESLLARYPRQLSGGQRQRVAMGRAIVRAPKVFLFDEPLSNLDAKLRVQMRAEIKNLQNRLSTTTVYVTHDQIEAMTMADKIVVMNRGNIEQTGSPLELYDKPANTFVAGFIGSPAMNFILGTYHIKNGASYVGTGDGGVLNLGRTPGMADGTPVLFGIRPDEIGIDEQHGSRAVVEVVEPTGSETYVVARLCGQAVTCVFRERISFRHGDTISLSFTSKNAHFFNEKDGRRIA
ncbi:MAG: sn-glycerol-3-phosphate ABC transporter ATP-binding protein UgpC [Planctomycetota bacterium]|jgi:multiple sugar transport system ATP-binding protein|nr:sn-glycerol-3-phosphate ABC transporter ATP-binding protein UgpC [Planctomycetota bacterium]